MVARTGLAWSEAVLYALAIDPVTPSILYAGTTHDGVFKSTNGGGNWSAVNTGLTLGAVYALAIDPVTPTIVYAGTESDVFKSTNGGGNWSLVHTRPDGRLCWRASD